MTPDEQRLDVIGRLSAMRPRRLADRAALAWAIDFLRTAEAAQRHRDELFRLTQGQTWRDPRTLTGNGSVGHGDYT